MLIQEHKILSYLFKLSLRCKIFCIAWIAAMYYVLGSNGTDSAIDYITCPRTL